MNKTLLATSIALSLGIVAPSANAAFTALSAGDYTMNITGGCFDVGNCQVTGDGAFTDNTAIQASTLTTVSMPSTRAVGSTIGSGIAGDGLMGVIDFSLDTDGNLTVTSFSQDSYLNSGMGWGHYTFYLDALGADGFSLMAGNIDGSGNMSFTPTGRVGSRGISTDFGQQPWNESKKIGMYDSFTTGTSTNVNKGTSPSFTLTGSALQDDGIGGWAGTLVSAGNINGDNWSGFNDVQFSEVFEITITASAVPVPAAAWLFGSGLIGLIGIARRKKA